MSQPIKQPLIVNSIKTIDNLVKRYGNSHLKEIDLTHSQTNVIIFLHQESHRLVQQRDIEHSLNLTNPTVSVLLSRLEEKGFVRRITKPEDNRSRIIELTDKVEPIIQEIYEHVRSIEELLFEGLDEAEINALSESLRKVALNAKKRL
ncbi:MarR family winged helix-turn-helix transcriptional regulator [Brevibacillus centrosporus]|uniref:MarR family winged helix-turn-helix transcriptional regulator n=1 Tax=Brevibacillus centrosporus TaxID=54910 RepID=UPI002E221C96|nr:MarR family transcriptional regulator [Brevibacillus centrosporus]MED1953635.1 MarR family transcriptional regulator [Brevibacillus centrosporus]